MLVCSIRKKKEQQLMNVMRKKIVLICFLDICFDYNLVNLR